MRISLSCALLVLPALASAACTPAAPPATPVVTVAPPAPGAQPPAEPARPMATHAPPAPKAGLTFEEPIEACGPRHSYKLVANYKCDDGSTPLGGDPRAGAQARRGSSKSHMPHDPADFANSHIVDIYRVPCAGGDVTLFVCMYHCDKGQTPLGGSAAGAPLSPDSM